MLWTLRESIKEADPKGERIVNQRTSPSSKDVVFHPSTQKAVEKNVLASESYKFGFKSWLRHYVTTLGTPSGCS